MLPYSYDPYVNNNSAERPLATRHGNCGALHAALRIKANSDWPAWSEASQVHGNCGVMSAKVFAAKALSLSPRQFRPSWSNGQVAFDCDITDWGDPR